MVSQETIDEIYKAAPIEKVVQDYVKLKKAGVNLVGICPFHSEKSGSFTVSPQKEIYKCFGCGKSGRSVNFIMEQLNLSYVGALKHLANRFGVVIDESEFSGTKKDYIKPVEIQLPLDEKTEKWLTDVRKISRVTLMRFKVCNKTEWMPQTEKQENCICFKYYENEELVNVKYRDGAKNFKLEKGAKLIFFNIDSIKTTNEAIITEGEIDALTAYDCGLYNVVSVPNGASKGQRQQLEYLDNNIDDFINKQKVYIATDNDHAGILLRDELVRRIGNDKCWIVTYPDGCKDLNDVLVKHGKEAVTECINSAKQPPVEGIFEVNDFEQDLDDLFRNGYPETFGIGYPEFDKLLRFVPGRVNTFVGIPSHGKTDFTDQICVRLSARNGWKIGFFSPERQPSFLHTAMLAQLYIGKPFFHTEGRQRMSQMEFQAAKEFIQEHFLFFNVTEGESTIDGILAKAQELVVRFGINKLVIDPFNYLDSRKEKGVSSTDIAAYILSTASKWGKKNKCSVTFIVHPTKMKKNANGKYEIPTLYDANGSANFFNMTDNGGTVYRNFEDNSVSFYCQKVKFKWEGKVGEVKFKYDIPTGRYAECVKEHDIFAERHHEWEKEYNRVPTQEKLSFEDIHGFPEEWK